MQFMREKDAISGKLAKAFITINGRVEELFYAKSIEATIERTKVSVPVLGRTNTPQVSSGWTGSGTMTIWYVTSLFRQLMLDYIKNGRDFWFDLMIVNEDPQSDAGRQRVVLKNCNLDDVVAARFDATTDEKLDEEIAFTFNDYDILESFNPITGV